MERTAEQPRPPQQVGDQSHVCSIYKVLMPRICAEAPRKALMSFLDQIPASQRVTVAQPEIAALVSHNMSP
jgi:hypothetical protein